MGISWNVANGSIGILSTIYSLFFLLPSNGVYREIFYLGHFLTVVINDCSRQKNILQYYSVTRVLAFKMNMWISYDENCYF